MRTSAGTYHASGRVPTGGNWKSLVLLARGDTLEAVPIAMPADPVYGLPAIEPPASRTDTWAPAQKYLVREFRGGVPWPAYLLSAIFVAMVAAWAASLALAYREVGRIGAPSKAAEAPSIGRRERRKRVLS